MAVQFVLRSTFLLLLTCGLAAAAPPPPPNAKPGCKADCGNVTSIPYPFGIGPGCYMDDWFEIDCNATGAFLKRISMEVLQIDISSDESERVSTVVVKSPIIYSYYCRNRTGGTVNLTGSPFVFSSSLNMFTAVGCDNFATMTAIEPMVVGCKSECNVSNSYRSEELKCSGVDCCQSTIPSRLQVFSAEFRSKDNQSPGSECKYAFLADQKWFESNITVPTSVGNREYVPVVLDWEIYNSTQNSIQIYESLQRRSESNIVDCYEIVTTSGGNMVFSSLGYLASSSRNFSSFFCDCATGYKGNPYLSCEGKL